MATGRSTGRWRALGSVLLAVLCGILLAEAVGLGPAPAWGFQDPPADAMAEGGGEAGGGDLTVEQRKQESMLSWMIRSSGVFGLLILICSFILVALIMMCVLQCRRDNLLPQDFIDEFEEKLEAKDYQGAYEIARNDDSFLARVLAAGLGKLNRGYEEAIEGMQEAGEDENMALDHRMSYLALIGSVAPMLGLMGTVQGMILSFQKIATSATAPKPAELADGIATALFTTIEGLVVAIPAIVSFVILKNRTARFVLEIGMISEGLMSRFSTLGKAKAGGAAPAPAAPRE